jgi:DNA-binding transcriptional regulator LsrR (DeoR family)
MPSLRDLLDLASAHLEIEPERLAAFERALRVQWGGERIYVIPVESPVDPSRAEHARELAKRLPTGVVAQRTGLSERHVRRLVRRR